MPCLRAALAVLLCHCCDVGDDPCCGETLTAACQQRLDQEAVCTAHGGNWFADAGDPGFACELSDAGSGPP
jgi:hypothetical protein